MKQIETLISPLVEQHFPEFYRAEGPLFVLFAKEYYKWLESDNIQVANNNIAGASIYHSRQLPNYRDIDSTIDDFLVYFKEKYLKGLEFDTLTDKRRLIKSAQDLFRSKGSERSIDLLFKLVFGTKIEIYTPGDDILRLSDGKWVVPTYLEVTRSNKTLSFAGKRITGSASGASAFVEYIVTRNIKGKLIDILYLSSLQGNFATGDIINTSGSIDGCPVVVGSLSTIDITLQGEMFSVGEIVNIVSARGVEGKARVTGVEVQTGIVRFTIIDGGWGYTLNSETTVSTKVLTLANDIKIDVTYSPTSLPSGYTYYYSGDVYRYDRFFIASGIELNNNLRGAAAIDSTLLSFLQTDTATVGVKRYDVNSNLSLDEDDVNAFFDFAKHSLSSTYLDWFTTNLLPAAAANSYIKSTYLDYGTLSIPLFSQVSQNLYSLTIRDITGEIYEKNIVRNATGATATVISSDQAVYTNNALLIAAPTNSSNLIANGIFTVDQKFIFASNTSLVFNTGDTLYCSNATTVIGTGVVEYSRPVTILGISGSVSTNNGLHVGTFVFQPDTGASGFISATPGESNFGYTNVSIIAISNTNGTFNGTSALNIYDNSQKTTLVSTATAANTQLGYLYSLNKATSKWSTGASVYKKDLSTSNTVVKIASQVGGKLFAQTSVTATGNVIAVNATAIGIKNVTNAFYGTGTSTITVNGSTVSPNITFVSTGTGASFSIGTIENTETVLYYTDGIVGFTNTYITGVNNGSYGTMSGVYVFVGGSGYSNTDKVQFTGGNTGVGSFGAANASVTTDGTGSIIAVTLTANTGNNYTTNPTFSILNSGGTPSSGVNANIHPYFALNFSKLPGGTIANVLYDLLTIDVKTIGTISSITGVNPGENYNTDPFILVYEPTVAALGKRDYIITLNNINGSFITGETITQIIPQASLIVTSNTFTGNTSNSYAVGEAAFSTDGIANVATGIIYSTTRDISSNVYTTVLTGVSGTFSNTVNATILTVASATGFVNGASVTQGTASGTLVNSNSTTLSVKSVTGTFQANSTLVTGGSGGSTTISATSNTQIYTLKGQTSKGSSYISNTQASTADASARAVIKSYDANTKIILARRTSLYDDFYVSSSNNLIGSTSAANASILSVIADETAFPAGVNANIAADVVSSEGAITSLSVIDTGFGYVQDETASIISDDGERIATGKVNVSKEGYSEGRYISTDGFPDNTKYIHDGEYYQEYSYEVQSSLPFERYEDILKKVVHIAGTKLFGSIKISESVDSYIEVSNSSISIA